MYDHDRALLVRVLWQQATTYDSDLMRGLIREEARASGATVEEDAAGNLYATKGIADLYPCLVAHMDTVHDLIPAADYRVLYDPATDDYWAQNAATERSTGVGGDDKAGIFIALAMLRDLAVCKAFFAADEEAGCVGTERAEMDWFADVSLAVQCDRRGIGEVIGDVYGVELLGDECRAALTPYREVHGMRYANGALTDVYRLKTRGLGVAAMNVACGYYFPHTSQEYIRAPDLARAHAFVRTIVDGLGDRRWPHVADERWHTFGWAWTDNDWDDANWRLADSTSTLDRSRLAGCTLPGCGTSRATCPRCDKLIALPLVRCRLCGERDDVIDGEGHCPDCGDWLDGIRAELKSRPTKRCRFCQSSGRKLDYDETEQDWFCWACLRYQGERGEAEPPRTQFERRARVRVR